MNGMSTEMDLCLSAQPYKDILKKFDFAKAFVDDPNIFNSGSDKLRNFLIQAFAHIHPDFHYLSFLNKEIDQEIVRAAEILQILPVKINKTDKLFDSLTEYEIKKFWSRLFALLDCKVENNFGPKTSMKSHEEKFDFFKHVSKTLDYVQYELPVVKEKDFSNEMLNKEIEKWESAKTKSSDSHENSSSLNYDVLQVEYVNIEKLLINLKQVTSILKHTQFATNDKKPEHLQFFINLIELSQVIDQYVKNLQVINSVFLSELHYKMLLKAKLVNSSNLCFLKRCSNFVKTLKYKNKFLQ